MFPAPAHLETESRIGWDLGVRPGVDSALSSGAFALAAVVARGQQ